MLVSDYVLYIISEEGICIGKKYEDMYTLVTCLLGISMSINSIKKYV